MSMVAVAIGGSALIGAGASIMAGNKAAGAQQKAANQAIDEQRREFDLTQQNNAPFLQAGQNAVNLQQQYLNGDTSGFDQSPDYQFAVQQGTKQLDAGAAAHGNIFGGGADADRIALGQGLATQYANNYWNKLAGMAGQGQTASAQNSAMGANAANNIGNYQIGAGQARASSYANTANAIGNLGNQFAGMYGQGMFNRTGFGGSGFGSGAPSGQGYLGGTNYLGQFNQQFPALNTGTFNLATAGTGVGG